ncbi:MAG: DUF2878 domain-containing protein [Elusimicrobiota bacterium]|nr:DUF2878 domain-containing protein [Elusimicrobiota bacterium]
MSAALLNYLGFQAGWLANVMGAGREAFLLGPAVSLLLLGAHAAGAADRRKEAARLLAVAAFGLALELAFASLGRYEYAGSGRLPLPLWVVSLWLLFAATLDSSLRWLSDRPVLACVLGAFAGPLSFQAGVGLGAGRYLASAPEASVLLSVLWALALPGAFAVSRRFS